MAKITSMLQLYKQYEYPGQQQVDLKVKILIPGSWFGQGAEGSLTQAERREKYEAVAVEYNPKYILDPPKRGKPPQVVEAIRFVCPEDAGEDDQHEGYWIGLSRWNQYRRDTFKDRPNDEMHV